MEYKRSNIIRMLAMCAAVPACQEREKPASVNDLP